MRLHVVPDPRPEPLPRGTHPLEVFFAPESVAVFGATEAPGSAGRVVMANLIRYPFGGTLFPINPKRPGVLGVKAYPALRAVPLPVELAVVATPAPTVPDILEECAAAGVKAAIVISAGFEGSGPAGAELQRQLVAQLRPGSLRVLGPNSLGLVCPRTGLNATFAPGLVRRGGVGFLSQSGALLPALLSDDLPDSVGCSAFVSLGSAADLGWAEWLDYFADDPQTEVLAIYAEDLGDARAFFRAVRRVGSRKPVILVQGGRKGADARRAGTLAGHHDLLEELYRRTGVLRVETIADLIRMADLLSTQPAPRGRRLTVVSNTGAGALLATDALLGEGGVLAPLAPATTAALDEVLPGRCPRRNPIDLGADADAARFARAAAVAAADPNSDALLLLVTPHATIDPLQAAEEVSGLAGGDRPVLACWMWGAGSPACLATLNRAGIPTFPSPDAALRALGYLWRHGENLELVRSAADPETPPGNGPADAIVAEARQTGRTRLTGAEACRLLEAYCLPAVETQVTADLAEAVARAAGFGYPVLLAPAPPGAAVPLQLTAGDEDAVRWAYRTLKVLARGTAAGRRFRGVTVRPAVPPDGWAVRLHSVSDAHLGPVLRLGPGGLGAPGVGEPLLALPPLTPAAVRQFLGPTALGAALAAVEQFLVRFSRLVAEQRWVKEICIDPLVVGRGRLIAVDPHVTLYDLHVREEHLPEPVVRWDAGHDLALRGAYAAQVPPSWLAPEGRRRVAPGESASPGVAES
jgi:acetyltransferase